MTTPLFLEEPMSAYLQSQKMSQALLETTLFLVLPYLLGFVYLPIYEHFIANLIKASH